MPSEMNSVQSYLKDLRKYPPLSREEEQQTLRRARKGDQDAVDRLITSNLRFVVSVAAKYRGRGLPFSELIAEGNAGLLEALGRFDENRGYKFISYAVWWIQQSIQQALKRTGTVPTPANRQEDMSKIARRWREMTQHLGRTPTLDEVSIDMKITRERVERALHSALPDLRLDSPLDVSDDTSQTLLNILRTDDPDPDRLVLERNRRELIERSLSSCLDEREDRIIRLYFGLDDRDGRTLEVIGRELGITRERVRQIRNRALGKLSHFFQRRSAETVPSSQDFL